MEEAHTGTQAQPEMAAEESHIVAVDTDGHETPANDGPTQEQSNIPIVKALRPSQLVEGQTLTGVVTRVQDSFGFIRSPELNEELFFHISALLREPRGKRHIKQNMADLISQGDAVEAIVGADHNRSSARMIAKQVTIVTRGAPLTPLMDDAPQAGAPRGRHQPRDPIPLDSSNAQRELGTVTMRKQHFGFIKCVERMGDLFFHESAVAKRDDGTSEKIGPGDDVEFSVGQDPKTKQKVAFDIKKMPKGSAVFDSVSEQLFEGVVVQRLALGRDYVVVSAGLIEYVAEDAPPQKITYGAQDLAHSRINPQLQERVSFRIATSRRATNAAQEAGSAAQQHAGRRAVEVSPLRYTGRVVMVRDHFGFIQCQDLPTEADAVSRWSHKSPSDEGEAEPTPNGKHDAAKRKKKLGNRFQIFFSLAEVEGESELKGGDEVEFVLGMQKGDRVARRVRFKSRPAPLPEPSVTPLGERRKLFVDTPPRADGMAPHPPVASYTPKGPDGTRGFTFGRGRGLPRAPSGGLLSRGPSGKLDPKAPEFVPTSLSGATSGRLSGGDDGVHGSEQQLGCVDAGDDNSATNKTLVAAGSPS